MIISLLKISLLTNPLHKWCPERLTFITWSTPTHNISWFYTILGHLLIISKIRSSHLSINIGKGLKFPHNICCCFLTFHQNTHLNIYIITTGANNSPPSFLCCNSLGSWRRIRSRVAFSTFALRARSPLLGFEPLLVATYNWSNPKLALPMFFVAFFLYGRNCWLSYE